MSQHSKREVVDRLQPRYLQADRKKKSKILDEFVAVTGMHRKAAIRRLRQQNKPHKERRGRQKIYTGSVVSALTKIWRICGCICGKRLHPILPDMVTSLARHQELKLDKETEALLLSVSPATIDRLLQSYKPSNRCGVSTTKPSGLLKHQIPVGTFAEKNDQCLVEQKNWSIVRRTIGYQRYESKAAHQLLGEIYAELHLFTNMFQPTFKLKSKKRNGAKVSKRYEQPKTPLQRVLDMQLLSVENSHMWQTAYQDTNPTQLRRRIDQKVQQLLKLGK